MIAGYLVFNKWFGYRDRDVPRIVGWSFVGMASMTLFFLWIWVQEYLSGGEIHHPTFLIVDTVIAGALLGFVVGTYNARSHMYYNQVNREKMKYEFLHRELRHHVLNGLTVVKGKLSMVRQSTEEPEIREETKVIESKCSEIVDYVEDVRMVTEVFMESSRRKRDLDIVRKDLSKVIKETTTAIERGYDVEINCDIEEEVYVSGDRFLPRIFEHLLTNAIEHGGGKEIRVSMAVEGVSVLVSVSDTGEGVPESVKKPDFDWDELSGSDIGLGVGLALVKVMVDRYGGEVWLEDNEPKGTVAKVELPRIE
ncbi:MAG: sensor histidine kinase [Halobacteria archaeon]